MPESVREYVLVHELMHLRVANHSRRFWVQVAAACPEYELARAWLRRHGRELL
jgi:predicted metal-dependent hydrolase